MIAEVHDGPGVLPGRYAGPDIKLVHSPTSQQVAVAEERAEADVLAGRICAAAAMSAQSECQLLELIGVFDAINAVRWWTDVKSLAHWLSWACSMSPGGPGACPSGEGAAPDADGGRGVPAGPVVVFEGA